MSFWKYIGLNFGIRMLPALQMHLTIMATWICYTVGLTVLSVVLDSIGQDPTNTVQIVLCFIVPLPDSIHIGIKTWRGCGVLSVAIREWQVRKFG